MPEVSALISFASLVLFDDVGPPIKIAFGVKLLL